MKREIRAQEYIDLAYMLAGRDAGRGRPRTAYLRRATSTAYYSLFHTLAAHGSRWVIPHGADGELAVVTRWFSHGNLRSTSAWVKALAAGRQPPKGVDTLLVDPAIGAVPRDLQFLSDAFIELQDSRHAADYSPQYDAQKYETLQHVALAAAAVGAAERLWGQLSTSGGTKARQYGTYLLLSLGGPRMVKNND